MRIKTMFTMIALLGMRLSAIAADNAKFGTVEATDGFSGSAAGLTNFPVNVVQTNQTQYTTTVAKASTAWQNPASSTNWTWTKTATEVTLTGYTGPNDVVIPDMLDNLPVTGFGTIFDSSAITSISGGKNITTIGSYALNRCYALASVILPSVVSIGEGSHQMCTNLTSVTLPSVTSVGDGAFTSCSALTSLTLPSAVNIGSSVFYDCPALISVTLPSAVSVGGYTFMYCPSLASVYFGQNAPAGSDEVYTGTPNVTNYVTNPTATGWGATWNGRPVVRLPVSADTFYGNASGLTNFPIVATASNALLLNGLTSEEIMQVGATYYFTTNVISYGAVTGRQASLTVPTVTQSSIYTGPVTAGQYFASYLIPSNQMPTVLEIGTYIFQFYGGHITQENKHPTIMGDLYVKDAVTGTTIQEFESLPVVIPHGTNEPFRIQITTTNAYPKDGYAFLLRTKLVDTDGYTGNYQSQFGPRGYAGFTLSRVVGVYVTHAEWDAVTPYRINWNTNNTYSAGTTQDFRNAVLLGGTVTISNLTVTGGNVVQTNSTDVTFAGWNFQNATGTSYLQPLQGVYRFAFVRDSDGKSVFSYSPLYRVLYSTNEMQIADFSDVFRVGPNGGTNIPVYLTLTNLNAQMTTKALTTSNTFTGIQKLSSNAIAWDDMLSSASAAFNSGVTDISNNDTLGGRAYATTSTTNAANDHLTFTFQTPHRRKLGSEMHPHLHFYQTNADQTNCWFMYYAIVPLGSNNVSEIFSGPATNEFTYTGGTMHQYAEFPSIGGSEANISSIIRIKLHRRGTSGTGSITVTDFDLHYQVDGFGSDSELNKSY